MKDVLTPAARRLLQVVLAAGAVFLLGVLNTPNLTIDHVKSLGIVFLVAAVAAIANFVTTILPFFSWAAYVKQPIAAWLDAFTQAVVGFLVVAIPGAFDAPNLDGFKTLIVAAIVGALTAGIRALEGLLTPGENPNPGSGIARHPDSKVFGLTWVKRNDLAEAA